MNKTRYNRIKAELVEAGRQNTDLARHLGIHVTTVSDWCTNTNQPSIRDLYKIAEFLRIDTRSLLVPVQWDANSPARTTKKQAVKGRSKGKKKTK
jgi:putative transcriptional regulator